MTTKEELPIMLEAKHIQEILNIGRRRAYEIMDIEDFPLIRLGRRKMVQRDRFFEWLDKKGGVA